jgi:uncharacterized protein YbjT (DUF2867 family)
MGSPKPGARAGFFAKGLFQMYVVTGASGNIGGKITETLLHNGKKVRVVGRDAGKLKLLADKGAEVWVGSLQDEVFLGEVFTGANAVYTMTPINVKAENLRVYQNRIGEAIFTALKNTQVDYVVNLSGLGAHRPDKTGPILGLYDQEQRLNWLRKINVVHLRPPFFMEDILYHIRMPNKEGIYKAPLKGSLAIPVIATDDVAKVASDHLLKLDFKGIMPRELFGPGDISMNDMTQILGKALHMDNMQYVQISYEDAEKAMRQTGFSPDVAKSFSELYKSINQGVVITGTKRTEGITTETSFEEFAAAVAASYHSN